MNVEIVTLTMALDPGDTCLEPVVFSQRVARFINEVRSIAERDPDYVMKTYGIKHSDISNDSIMTVLGAKLIRESYSKGVCRSCHGPAEPCAKRHTIGRSCA